MMRLMRRSNSETDSTSTRREVKRLLLLLLGVAVAVSVALFALNVVGSALSGSGDGPRESILSAVGFGSVLIAGWAAVFIFALAFRRDWLRRYNLWLASVALIIAAIGALAFLSPSEGLLGWFALGGKVSPGGQLGDLIIGSQGWTGLLRVLAALAVAGALFALPALQSGWDALASLFNRRGEAAPSPFAEGPQFFENEDREDDTRVAPVPVMGASSARSGFVGNPSSWYTNSEPVWARETTRVRPDVGSDAPYTDSSRPRPSIFDSGNMPIHSAPVPSLANYLDGMKGSDSVEAGIRSALAAPPAPEPEPATTESRPSEDNDPFRPLSLSKLPEPVFAFTTEPVSTPELAEEDEPDAEDTPEPETPDLEEAGVPLSESADLEEFDDQDVDADDEYIDDKDFDFDSDSHAGMANGSQNVPETVESDPVIVSGVSRFRERSSRRYGTERLLHVATGLRSRGCGSQ